MTTRISRRTLIAAILSSALVSDIAFAQGAKTELKYAVVYPPVGVQADGAANLARHISEASGARLTMKFFPSSQLGDKLVVFEGLRAGAIEMTEAAASDLSNFDKMWSVFSLPFLFNDGEHAIKVVTSPAVSKLLNESAEAAGFKIIGWWNMGERSVLNKKRPVEKPNDLKGMKIRVMQDPILAKAIGSMGAIGTPMAWGEVYSGVQQGVIDGLENSPPVITANKLQEVAKYFSLTQQFIIPDPQMISKKTFDGLPPDLQQAVLKAGKSNQDDFNRAWGAAQERELAALKASGVKVNTVDKAAFRESVKPMIDDFLKSSDEKTRALYQAIQAAR